MASSEFYINDINTIDSKEIFITNIDDFTDKVVLIGFVESPTQNKHGFNKQTTLYGVVKMKYLSLYKTITITINFMSEEMKSILELFHENQTTLSITDQDGVEYAGCIIDGESLSLNKKHTLNGELFYTGSLEMRG